MYLYCIVQIVYTVLSHHVPFSLYNFINLVQIFLFVIGFVISVSTDLKKNSVNLKIIQRPLKRNLSSSP